MAADPDLTSLNAAPLLFGYQRVPMSLHHVHGTGPSGVIVREGEALPEGEESIAIGICGHGCFVFAEHHVGSGRSMVTGTSCSLLGL